MALRDRWWVWDQVGAQERALAASKDATDRQLAQASAQADAVRSQVAQLQAEGAINPQDSQQAITSLQVGPLPPPASLKLP